MTQEKKYDLLPSPNSRWLHIRVDKSTLIKFKSMLLHKDISMQLALEEFVLATIKQNSIAMKILDDAVANKARRRLKRIEKLKQERLEKVTHDVDNKELIYAMIEEEK